VVVFDRGGTARGIPSRAESDPGVRGTKHSLALGRQVFVTRGRRDGRTLVIVPEVKDGTATGIALADIDLSAAEVQLVHEVAREQTLSRVLQGAVDDYDVILIDCQPSLGLLTVNALTAAHGVIVPLECEYFALRGVALLKTTIDKVRERLNPKLEIEGVLGTMFDGRTLHSREVMERLVSAWGDKVFHTVIRRTVKFSDATVAGEPITAYASSSTGAEAYRQLAKEVLTRWPAE